MKTPLKIILVLSALLYMSEAVAQTYYYDVTKTFYESGYTYQCDVKGMVVLYNKENKFTYTDQTYKDGSYSSIDNWVRDVEKDAWTKALAYSIVNNAFSEAEKNRVRGRGEALGVTMIISPETGKVIEVEFDFSRKDGYATIPVSVYRQIETELKSKICFTPTAEGKKKNYLMRFWQQEVK